jgi:hypothetical protein
MVAGLVILTGACYGTQPLRGVVPADYVDRARPPHLVVITTRGRTVEMVRPVVARDSLIATEQHTTMEEVTIARPPDSAVTPLPPDARGFRRIGVRLPTGEQIEFSRPRFIGDSLSGLAPVTRNAGFAIALADIRGIGVRRLNSTATFVAVFLGVGAAGLTLFFLTFSMGGPSS